MSTENKNPLMQLIQTASPSALLESPEVADRFKFLYKTIHGIKDPARAEAFYAAEKFHFLKLVNDSANIKACTKLSLYGVFMDVSVSGLSFDPSMKHLYIVPYNVNVGTKENKIWEKRAALQISGQGELLLRTIQGQVKYVDNVVLVYEGDEFRFGTRDGQTIVEHMACIPRKSTNIIASFLKITRHDGTFDYKVMTSDEIANLRKFSKDQDSLAWTAGYAGMVQAKTIKHAFKNYPKVRVGEFSKLASEVVDETPEEIDDIDYGITPDAAPSSEASAEDENAAFSQNTNQQPHSQGVTHEDENF